MMLPVLLAFVKTSLDVRMSYWFGQRMSGTLSMLHDLPAYLRPFFASQGDSFASGPL